MFERYTEKARRTVFFARYYAERNGCEHICPEHLLLALLREDRKLLKRFCSSEALKEISAAMNSQSKGGSPSNDFKRKRIETVSDPCKWVLAYAAQEANLDSANAPITPGHLLIGILFEQKNLAAQVLIKHGVGIEAARQLLREKPETPFVSAIQRLLHRFR